MQVVADRFVCPDRSGEALDLATTERVRLYVDGGLTRAAVAARTAACDRLANLRHPLLVPLVDYGAHGRDWFEAYALAGSVRVTADQLRRAVPHLGRFLRAAGVELTAQMAARGVAGAAGASGSPARPVGVFLRERAALEAMRTLLESDGPAGMTVVDVAATAGAGLRTFRLQVARLARLAGFVVLDARAAAVPWTSDPPCHVCALDWLPRRHALPHAMAEAAAGGGRRHLWIRFGREACDHEEITRGAIGPVRGVDPRPFLRLEPMMRDELTEAIFPDPELGPTAAEVRTAVDVSGGIPGRAVAALSEPRPGAGAGWVHETSPEYSAEPEPPRPPLDAGTSRLRRAIETARTFAARGRHAQAARLFERCAAALAARGAVDAAGPAACDLGELLLDRAQPKRAAAAFAQAREWSRDAAVTVRALLGTGRAFYELDRMRDAEAAFRTAAAASEGAGARVWLARTLWRRGELDAARHAVGDACPALLSRILLQAGRVEEAAAAARHAVSAVDAPPNEVVASSANVVVAASANVAVDASPSGACEAHTAAAHVHAVMCDADGVRRHMDAAMRAATRMRHPARRFEVAAERWACLGRCGVSAPVKARDRLLRVAARLPPRAAATIRTALGHPAEPEVRVAAPVDLVAHFQHLIDATHDAGDEAAALQRIAAGVLDALGACSVVIRSARPNQIAGAAGRPWPGEAALALPILNGGASVTRDGITPDAVVAIAAAGAIVGSLSVRWVAGAHAGWDRVTEILRVTAVAAAPLVRAIKAVPDAPETGFPDDLLGRGAAVEGVRQAIRRAAAAPYPVLIEGESGSGKELVARAIHARGLRRARRFCAVNCAALADDLLEAELFGHARGAFTGATTERAGLFEDADQGTLLLDEVGELSARAQAKLLRVLQEGEVRRVGENLSRRVDVRVVAATNCSLEHEAVTGRFRADLRFRLDVIRITIPPLRERVEDIPWLAARIWTEAAGRVGSRATLGDDTMAALARYDWPGNVRELQNVIASLAVHGPRRGRVPAALLPSRIAHEAAHAAVRYDDARAEFDRRFIRAALARAGGRRALAAEQVGLSRQRLVKILNRLELDV